MKPRYNKELNYFLTKDEEKSLTAISALDNIFRLRIINSLLDGPKTITELSHLLSIPNSNVIFHLGVLEKAGILRFDSYSKPILVSLKTSRINFLFDFKDDYPVEQLSFYEYEIPVGNYIELSYSVKPLIVAASKDGYLNVDCDNPYDDSRFYASLIVLGNGNSITYPLKKVSDYTIKELEIDVEICSEAPMYRNEYKSDIAFYINNVFLCTYLTSGDFGGRRGHLNPDWYGNDSSQYGVLVHINVSKIGVFINGILANTEVTIASLNLDKEKFYTFKMGNTEKSLKNGGLNIFGKNFGDYPIDIKVKYYF